MEEKLDSKRSKITSRDSTYLKMQRFPNSPTIFQGKRTILKTTKAKNTSILTQNRPIYSLSIRSLFAPYSLSIRSLSALYSLSTRSVFALDLLRARLSALLHPGSFLAPSSLLRNSSPASSLLAPPRLLQPPLDSHASLSPTPPPPPPFLLPPRSLLAPSSLSPRCSHTTRTHRPPAAITHAASTHTHAHRHHTHAPLYARCNRFLTSQTLSAMSKNLAEACSTLHPHSYHL